MKFLVIIEMISQMGSAASGIKHEGNRQTGQARGPMPSEWVAPARASRRPASPLEARHAGPGQGCNHYLAWLSGEKKRAWVVEGG